MTAEDHPFAWADRIDPDNLASGSRMEGYYNYNFRVEEAGVSYLYRKPIPNSAVMDLRCISEVPVLRLLERVGFDAPRLLYQSDAGGFFIHDWIDGVTINDVYPDQVRMPDWIPFEVARKMAALHCLDPEPFAAACTDLGASPDCQAFFRAHYDFDCSVHARLFPDVADVYRRLEIPDEPFAGLDELAINIGTRPFCLCHSDIHRKNVLIRPRDETLSILDWELVLVGDPIYDIAVHFHKMRFMPDQEARFLETYAECSPLPLTPPAIRAEVDLYLRLERVKSAIIDACRVRGDILSGKFVGEIAEREAARYARKLDKARAVWSGDQALRTSDPAKILHVLSQQL
ncbi:phosphotransferase family protein [Roseibium sp.]|uniref:phosphotransferase family protein n=1 Tax=Roseibium sp. TaxID=1936156 RepID=UPI003A9702F2